MFRSSARDQGLFKRDRWYLGNLQHLRPRHQWRLSYTLVFSDEDVTTSSTLLGAIGVNESGLVQQIELSLNRLRVDFEQNHLVVNLLMSNIR